MQELKNGSYFLHISTVWFKKENVNFLFSALLDRQFCSKEEIEDTTCVRQPLVFESVKSEANRLGKINPESWISYIHLSFLFLLSFSICVSFVTIFISFIFLVFIPLLYMSFFNGVSFLSFFRSLQDEKRGGWPSHVAEKDGLKISLNRDTCTRSQRTHTLKKNTHTKKTHTYCIISPTVSSSFHSCYHKHKQKPSLCRWDYMYIDNLSINRVNLTDILTLCCVRFSTYTDAVDFTFVYCLGH